MATIEIKVGGLDKLASGLERSEAIVRDEVAQALARVIESARASAMRYPPPRPGQRYRRTYRLRGGWGNARVQGRIGARAIEASIANPVPYAPYVQGDAQAWMHVGRWKTVDDIADDHRVQAQGELETALIRAAHRMTTGG